MTLRDFYRMLRGADWFYQYSDDPRQDGPYHRGQRAMNKIRVIASTSDDHEELFATFKEYIYGDGPMPPEPPCEVCGSVICGMGCECYGDSL